MSAMSERKIDCHCHILDPRRYPYPADVKYRPSGQEIGTVEQFHAVCDTYGVEHALIVGPNSGYGTDNRCLLDAVARSRGRFKGIAVVANDASFEELADLKRRGIVGIALNATYHGVDYYLGTAHLIRHLVELDMFLQIQVEGDQLVHFMGLIAESGVKLIIDHCGRPVLDAGLSQPGFTALCRLGATGRAAVKLSGLAKFSHRPFPHEDCRPYVGALVAAYGIDNCLWGSDWPFLRAPERIDYGPLVRLVDKLFPLETDRRALLWETPKRLFGFAAS
jgi:predicted TIM-barrel fold metal-dependent hydrolase